MQLVADASYRICGNLLELIGDFLESTKMPFANGRSRLSRILVNAITTIRSVLEKKSKGRPALRPLCLLRVELWQLSFESAAIGITRY